jgi:hypothetical protein
MSGSLLSIRVALYPFYLDFKILLSLGWVSMGKDVNKCEQKGRRRRKWLEERKWGGSVVLEMKRVTGDEKRIYKRERKEKLSSRVSPRRSEILWKFFHLSPSL